MRIYHIFIGMLFLGLGVCLFAAPWSGQVMELAQPDGSTVQVKIYGDEFYQRVESLDGYTLIRNPQNEWIEYAETNDDDSDYVATGVVYDHRVKTNPSHPSFRAKAKQFNHLKVGAGDNEPALKQSKRLKRDVILKKVHDRMREINPPLYNKMYSSSNSTNGILPAGESVSPAPLNGSVVGLTILIDFSDQVATVSQAEIEHYCNQPGYTGFGNASSVRDYFYDVSGGKLEYTNYVTTYYRAQHLKSYYEGDCTTGAKVPELIGEALQWLDSTGFDFRTVTCDGTRIKALNILYAGDPSCGWSKGLWPHQGWYSSFTSNEGISSYIYQMSNIGSSPSIYVFCHENGHMVCGYHDLYDYGGESAGAGNYCVMAGRPNDKLPMPFCGYLRSLTGWETVIDITSDPAGTLHQHTANTNVSYKYTNPNNSKEYFLIESRLKTGRNAMIPDEGLLIWHVDESGSNSNQEMTAASHYEASVEQADGLFQLETSTSGGGSGDLFHNGDKDVFSDSTTPNAYWWTETLSGLSITQISAVSGQMNFTVGASLPVAYWKFDGTWNDSSGAGKTMTGYNFPASPWFADSWTGGLAGLDQCIVFDGVDDYAQVSLVADGATTIGAAFWFCPDTVIQTVLVDKFPSGSGGAGWRIWLDDSGRLHFTIGSGDASTDLMTGQPVAVPGVWRHVGCTFTGGKAIIFINGQQVAEMTEVARTCASSEPITIGKSNAVALGQPFAGRMDELIIYASSLNDTRIQSLPGLNFVGRYGLSGYWKFDDISGATASDSGALANHATLNGGLTFGTNSVAGKFGKALSFDGVDDYILAGTGSATPGTGFSVCLWAYPTAVKNWARFIDFGNGSGNNNILLSRYASTNDLVFEAYNGTTSGGYVRVVGAIELNKWQFFTATIDMSGSVKLYKNGTLIQSGSSGPIQKITRSNAFIGHSNWSTDSYYQGLMDEVQTFNYVLTASQIQNLMTGIESHSPTPSDYSPAVPERSMLQWHGSSNAVMYAVYFGTSSAAVASATTDSPEFKGYRYISQFNPGNLSVNSVYYWRVDSILENGKFITGPVWNFTTSGSLTRQVYTDLPGSSVTNLTGAAKYPNSPDIYEYIPTSECPTSWADNYGTRLEGYITPQTSGSYTFWVASDNNSELWLSTNSLPANISKISSVTGYTGARQWTVYSSQASTARTLTAGQSYYFRVLQKEGDGGDNLAVAWRGPDSPTRSIIQSRFLSPYELNPAPKFTSVQITKPDAIEKIAYTQSLASDVTGGNGTFSKVFGPQWLTVASNGALSGTPANGQDGENDFTIQVRDSLNRTDQAVVKIGVTGKYDGGMGMADLLGFAQNWLATDLGNPAELNGVSPVDMQDLSVFSSAWRADEINGLEAYWTMDDMIGSVVRDSYGGHDGQIYNAAWNGTMPGRVEGALLLDGMDDYLDVPDYNGIGGAGGRTVSLWVKTSASGFAQGLVQWGADTTGQLWMVRLLATGTVQVAASGGGVNSLAIVNDGQWHHIAAVLDEGQTDSTQIRLYVDGQLDAVPTGSCAISTAQTVPVHMGCYYLVSSGTRTNYLQGMIDDVQIYSRALTLAEIYETTGAQLGMKANWKLDEFSGTTAKDAVGSYDGILNNMSDSSWVVGRSGNALTFDGTDDYVNIPTYTGIGAAGARTVSLWIKTSAAVYQALVQWGSDAAGQLWYMRLQTDGTVFASVYAAGVLSSHTVNDGQWHHIAAVLDQGQTDPTQIRLYIDGQLDAVPTGSGTINTAVTVPVRLGVWYRPVAGTSSNYFSGLMDEVRIYNRALTALEINEMTQ